MVGVTEEMQRSSKLVAAKINMPKFLQHGHLAKPEAAFDLPWACFNSIERPRLILPLNFFSGYM
jgi:hypothetical protein